MRCAHKSTCRFSEGKLVLSFSQNRDGDSEDETEVGEGGEEEVVVAEDQRKGCLKVFCMRKQKKSVQ